MDKFKADDKFSDKGTRKRFTTSGKILDVNTTDNLADQAFIDSADLVPLNPVVPGNK